MSTSALITLHKIYFGSDIPSAEILEQLTLIAMVNTHPVLGFPEPLPPNVIAVGGLSIQ